MVASPFEGASLLSHNHIIYQRKKYYGVQETAEQDKQSERLIYYLYLDLDTYIIHLIIWSFASKEKQAASHSNKLL